jgi:hypothetical protein
VLQGNELHAGARIPYARSVVRRCRDDLGAIGAIGCVENRIFVPPQ